MNFVRYASIGAFVLSILALFGSLASGEMNRDLLFSADELTPIVVVRDWLAGTSVFKITLTPGVYLPDHIITLLLMAVSGDNTALVVYGFALAMILITTFGWFLLAKECFGDGDKNALTFSLIAGAIMTLCAVYHPDSHRVMLHIAYHSTAAAAFPFGLWLTLRALYKPLTWRMLAALFAFPLLLSDRILIAWFIIPAIATVILLSILRREMIKKNMQICLALGAGSVALILFVEWADFIVGGEMIEKSKFEQWLVFAKSFERFKNFLSVWAAIYPVFAAVCVLWIGAAAVAIAKRAGNEKTRAALLLLLACFFAQLLLAVISGRFAFLAEFTWHYANMRFFIPAIFVPVSAGWIFIFGIPRSGKVKAVSAAVLCLLIFTLSVPRATGMVNARELTQYYPETVRCFDENFRRFKLMDGLSSFWFGNYLRALSTEKPKISHLRMTDKKGGGRTPGLTVMMQNWQAVEENVYNFVFETATQMKPKGQDLCMIRQAEGCMTSGGRRNLEKEHLFGIGELAAEIKSMKPAFAVSCGANKLVILKIPLKLNPADGGIPPH